MMSQVIRQETVVFLMAVFHGLALTLAYDIIRSFRRVFHHSLTAVSAEDFLFWIAAGFLTFCLLFLETDGVIRGYVVAGAALGVIFYLNTLSPLVLFLVSGFLRGMRKGISFAVRKTDRFLRWLKRLFGRIFRFLGRPLFGLSALWKKRIEFLKERVYNEKKRAAVRRRESAAHSGGRTDLALPGKRRKRTKGPQKKHRGKSRNIRRRGTNRRGT